MSRMNVVFSIMFLGLLLGLLLGDEAGLTLAGGSPNAEGDRESPLDKTLSSDDVEVAGVEAEQPAGETMANGEGQPETGVPTSVGEEVELQRGPEAPQAQFFKRATGSNFQPRDSDTTYSYGGAGCLRRDSNVGDSWFTLDLQLPDGAEIDFLRVYYYDTDATYDVNSELWAFDGAGGTALIAEADSSGSAGYSSAGSGFFSHTVDNINESLAVLAAVQGGVGSTLELCGIRIRYQYNLSGSYLPTILNMTAP